MEKLSEKITRDYNLVNRYKDNTMEVAGFYTIPVSRRSSMEIAAELIGKDGLEKKVLDFGANDKRFKKKIPSQATYRSLDRDTSFPHDYRHLEEVAESGEVFDLVGMFAVIEHIPFAEFIDAVLPGIKRVLAPGGYMVISSNNIFYNVGIRSDYTHVCSYSPRDLSAIMKNFGFETVALYRISLMPRWYRWVFDLLSRTLFKPYALDYCPEICWVFQIKE